MGYILPITQHTYTNYQYRMTDSKKSPHHIGPMYKVVFHKINEEYDNNNNETIKKMVQDDKMNNTKKIPAYQINSSQKAELTGKGGQFNEQV